MARTPWETAGAFDESFRILALGLGTLLGDLPLPVVAVTSSRHREGRTLTCAQLARTFAAQGRKVVAVGLDLHHPDLHLQLGGHNQLGAADHLSGGRKLGECLQYVETPGPPGRGLFLLAAGRPLAAGSPDPAVGAAPHAGDPDQATDPAEMLGGPRAGRMLERLAAQADIVVVDTPPILAGADALTIGRMAGGALVVVDTRRTSAESVRRARDLLERNGTRLLGMVLNQVRSGDPAAWLSDSDEWLPATS